MPPRNGQGIRNARVAARRAEGDNLHPTIKPIEFVRRLVKVNAPSGGKVLDMFCGSGTTLIACEETGRIGFGCEIEPRYAAVTLERLAQMGLTPKRVG
jgi:DNA modification methylase